LRLQPNSTLAQLEINPLMTADEDLYKCEVTYLEVKEHCALSQSIKLSTFGMFFMFSKFFHSCNKNEDGLHYYLYLLTQFN
jgi:hypothetical protein